MRFVNLAVAVLLFAANASAQICDPASRCSADWVTGCSPIIINFENGEYRLTGANAPVWFDISATGHPVWIGWTAAGADEAFLCIDRDHDGRITSGAELFGSVTPLADGRSAGNGFVALAELDENHDGVIDSQEAIWAHLLLWRDLNHDGISQAFELTPVITSNMTAIAVDYHWTGRRDRWNNQFRYRSTVWISGRNGHATPRAVYDVFFVPVP